MPELPDLTVYVEQLQTRLAGERIDELRIANPFVLRTVDPPIGEAVGRHIASVGLIGKQIVLALESHQFLLIHLMVAGRLRWRVPPAVLKGRMVLAALRVGTGTLYLTEAGTTRRAALWYLAGDAALRRFDRGGLDVFANTAEQFAARLRSENHTLKRALTDPRMLSGIGNAYSDEILHAARLSPLALTSSLSDAAFTRLFDATRETLDRWIRLLRASAGSEFPEQVTAFRPGMAVHGRFRQPCPVCGSPVQRIRYATNETNYCAHCQTGGRLLADRALSRLLKRDWPRSLDDDTSPGDAAPPAPPRRG